MIHYKSKIFTLLTSITVSLMLTLNVQSSALELDDIEFTSVDDATIQIQKQLEDRYFEVVLVVDHSAAAASVGLELRPTKVILARQPQYIEQKLLRRSDTVGIDMPLKVLIYEDETGDIQVRDNSIGYLIDRHDANIFDLVWRKSQLISAQNDETNTGLVRVSSTQSIQNTVDSLTAAISENPNFRIPLTVNFCEGKKRSCAQVIVFGNPNAGTPLMQASQEAGIDLPQKFLVSSDFYGNVSITYNDPSFVAERHGIEGQDARLEAISGALANFAAQGANGS